MVAHKRVGDKWSSDELYFRAARYKTAWLFGVMDLDSRYIIDHDASDSKQGYDATELYHSAVSIAGKKPRSITTDSLAGFARGICKVMGDDTSHINDAGINKVHANNNTYECFNGILKQRFRLARGFGSLHPGLHYLYIAYYNLFRPHSGIGGMTPAEKLGLVIKTTTGKITDKWITVIRHAALFCV